MSPFADNPAFAAYAVCALLLCVNLLGVWLYSGIIRSRTRTVVNPEDTRLLPGRGIVASDPPEVARALRAHANAMANIVPFLTIGLIYVLYGAPLRGAVAYFAVFTLARYLHTVTYVGGSQPLRTVSFVVGLLASIGLLVNVAVRALG